MSENVLVSCISAVAAAAAIAGETNPLTHKQSDNKAIMFSIYFFHLIQTLVIHYIAVILQKYSTHFFK